MEIAQLCFSRINELIDKIEPRSDTRPGSAGANVALRGSPAPGDRAAGLSGSVPAPLQGGDFAQTFRAAHGIELPMIPVSPMLRIQGELRGQLALAKSRFEASQNATDGDRTSVNYLSKLRRQLEDVEMLSSKVDQLDRDIKTLSLTKVTEFDAKVLAQQLTLLDMEIFRRIQAANELADCGWMKPDKRQRSPNVISSIDLFNYVTHWIQWEIIRGESAEERSTVFQHFVRVAQHLSEHCSFNMLKAVITSLKASGVQRLKDSIALIPRKVHTQLENYVTMLSEARNFSYLRTILLRRPKPAIPFLGMFLHVSSRPSYVM